MRWIPANERLPESYKVVPIKAYGKIGSGMFQENTMPKTFWYQTIDGIGTLTEDIFSRLQWLDEQSDELPKYEYESHCINRGHSESKTISMMAEKGYRLVAVAPYDIGNQLYFERPISKSLPQPPKQ